MWILDHDVQEIVWTDEELFDLDLIDPLQDECDAPEEDDDYFDLDLYWEGV
jgi:hypothetical protein